MELESPLHHQGAPHTRMDPPAVVAFGVKNFGALDGGPVERRARGLLPGLAHPPRVGDPVGHAHRLVLEVARDVVARDPAHVAAADAEHRTDAALDAVFPAFRLPPVGDDRLAHHSALRFRRDVHPISLVHVTSTASG